jgi:membrane fusion protein (multidrug efflux system)
MTTSTDEGAPAGSQRRIAIGLRGRLGAPTRPLRQRLRLPLMLAGPLAVIIAATWWFLTSGRYVSTDDAYVQASRTMISTDVSGRVLKVLVHDNQHVTAGQILFEIDPTTFQIAVDGARAQLANARLQVDALKATYRLKTADERGAEETLAYQQREYDRQKKLLASGVTSQAQFDQAANALEVARQRLSATQHDVGNTLAQLGGNPAIPIDQHPMVMAAQAALERALVDLRNCTIRAPESGIVTKVEQLQPGEYVNSGAPVFSLISDRVWIEANFKETELTHMRPGQEATVSIDTYPDAEFKARVTSLSPGTGLTFSLLPPENATGNWVKVVQRLPVRLTLEKPDPSLPLHAGLSATVEVDTKYRRPWLVWLENLRDHLFGPAQAGEAKR